MNTLKRSAKEAADRAVPRRKAFARRRRCGALAEAAVARAGGEAGAAGMEAPVVAQRAHAVMRRAVDAVSHDMVGAPSMVSDAAVDAGRDMANAAIDSVNDFRRARWLCRRAGRCRYREHGRQSGACDQLPRHLIPPIRYTASHVPGSDRLPRRASAFVLLGARA